MAKKNTLNLDLGFETFEIRFSGIDEPTEISFNPADEDLPKRLFEARDRIEASMNDIPTVTQNEDGTVNPEEYLAARNKVNDAIYAAIDYAFGAPVSEKVFSHCSPMAIVAGGEPFVFHFLEELTPHLERIIKKKNEKSNAYIQSKYGKYLKK